MGVVHQNHEHEKNCAAILRCPESPSGLKGSGEIGLRTTRGFSWVISSFTTIPRKGIT